MWTFTREGFFSVVLHSDGSSFCVRARRRGDLERLAKKIQAELVIEEGVGTDYLYRAKVDRNDFKWYLAQAAADIDYMTGVKDHIDCGEDDRHTAMYRVWSAMMTLQPADDLMRQDIEMLGFDFDEVNRVLDD